MGRKIKIRMRNETVMKALHEPNDLYMLGIWCRGRNDRTTKVRFQKVSASFDNEEEALKALLDLAERFPQELKRKFL